LPFFKLLTILGCESDLLIGATEPLSYFYPICLDVIDLPDVGRWGLAALAALIKNSPTVSSFVRSSPSFGKLKTNLAGKLSADDPVIVIASLAILVLLFPSTITPETSVRAAINSIPAVEDFPAGMHMISWIVSELNESAPLAAEELWKLLQFALKGKARSFVI
jgi:hypothetical protein